MQQSWTKIEAVVDGQPVSCQVLQPKTIQMIDEALASLGEFGEVRLVVERGRLRFLVTQRSVDLLKNQVTVVR